MDLMGLLQGAVKDQLLDQLSGQIGAEKGQTNEAMNSAFAAILNGLKKNVSQPGGAESLLSVLDRDHDGSIFDDLSGFVLGQKQAENPAMLNGAGILKHVLGGNAGNVVDAISQNSGVDKNKAMQILISAAPMVLGALGKAKQQSNVNAGGILDILMNSTKQANTQSSGGSIFEKLLDQNGDGNIMDDLLKGGSSILGGLFKK